MARRSNPNRRRDPNAPKRGKNAWQLFSAENRDQVAKENPDLNYREITRKLGEMWRESDDNAKTRYQKQYQASEAEYKEKLSAYKDEQKKKRQSSSSSSSSSNSKRNNSNSQTNKNTTSNEDNDQY